MTTTTQRKRSTRRRGAVMILMVLLLPIAVLMSAIAINLAYIELSRTEMIIATDAAARAGGRELIVTDSTSKARDRAKAVATLNSVAGVGLKLSDSDVQFGKSNRVLGGRYNFTVDGGNPNALRVSAHRDGANANGPIPLLMPSVLGQSSVSSTQEAISTQMEVDLGLVLDRSGSMAYAANEVNGLLPVPEAAPDDWEWGDLAPDKSRWRDLSAAVSVFTTELSNSPGNELISLSSYSDSALTNVSLTSNYAAINSAMGMVTQGWTNIGGGIAEGTGAILSSPSQRAGAAKVLVVMTDGIHNTGLDPIIAAQSAADAGIMIFTITFSDEADQTRMQQVAAIANGRHYHALTGSELKQVFRDIAASLPTLLTK